MPKVIEVPLVLDTYNRDVNSVIMANVNFKEIFSPEELSLVPEASIKLYETNSLGKPLKEIPVQVDFEANKVYWILAEVDSPAKFYRLRIDISKKAEDVWPKVEIKDDNKDLHVFIGKDNFATYKYTDKWKPFFYPINTPLGCVVRGRGEEHPHQHGLWMSYGGHMEAGSASLWSEFEGQSGRMVHRAFRKVVSGTVYAQFVEELDYVKPDGSKILDEVRDIKIYNLPPDGRYIDFELKLTPPIDAGTKPVSFHCRVADSMRITENPLGQRRREPSTPSYKSVKSIYLDMPKSANPGRIVNSEGYSLIKDLPKGASMPAKWIDFSGPVGSGWAGITLMDHPDNVGHPVPIGGRCYGIISIGRNYPSDMLPGTGRVLELKYRAYVHLGDADEAKVDIKYLGYANPPIIVVGSFEVYSA